MFSIVPVSFMLVVGEIISMVAKLWIHSYYIYRDEFIDTNHQQKSYLYVDDSFSCYSSESEGNETCLNDTTLTEESNNEIEEDVMSD